MLSPVGGRGVREQRDHRRVAVPKEVGGVVHSELEVSVVVPPDVWVVRWESVHNLSCRGLDRQYFFLSLKKNDRPGQRLDDHAQKR